MLLSVIIPVYNCEKYLPKCLISILAQTMSDYEVILINDGSLDSSGKICDDFCLQDTRFKVIHTKNGGVSRARNIGLNYASGEFVTFIDSDDWVDPSIFSVYMTAFNRKDVDAVKVGYYSDYYKADSLSASLPITCDFAMSFSDKADLYKSLEESKYYNFVWNLCVRKSVIGDLRFYENINWLEDQIFSLELYEKCKIVNVLPFPLYHYISREDVQSLSSVGNPDMIEKAAYLEYLCKKRINNGKFADVDRAIECNLRHNIHKLVTVLYTNRFSYRERKDKRDFCSNIGNLIYKEDKIYCSKISFLLSDIILKVLFYLKRIDRR